MNAPTIARWTTLGALFIIPFVALFVDNTLYFPFISGKGFAFRMLVEIALAGWIVLAFADKKYRPQFSWVAVFYGLLVIWMAIADFLAVNPHKAFWSNFERMDGWVTLAHVAIFFFVTASVLGAEKLWKNWWFTFIGASTLVCGYGLLQMGHFVGINQGATRIDANVGNAEYLAGYSLFAIAITLWLAFDTKEKKHRLWRYVLFAVAALQTLILVETGTRGTLIGFVVAAGFGILLWLFEAGKRGRQGAAVALVGLVVVVGGFLSIQHSPVITQNPVLSRFANIGINDLSVRFSIWNMAYQGFLERPVTGWGQDGFNYVFNKFYEPSLFGQEPWFDRVHNQYLDWLIAGGLPALLLFLALFASAIYGLYRGSVSRSERIMLMCAFVAYGVQSLVIFDNLLTYIPFAAMLALAHSARSKPIAALERLPEADSSFTSTTVIPVALVGLVLFLWIVNVPTVMAGKDLIKALGPSIDVTTRLAYFKQAVDDNGFASQEVREQLVQTALAILNTPNVPNDQKVAFVTYAVNQMKIEIARAPHDARLHLQLATLYRSAQDYKDAIQEMTLAIDESPRKQTLLLERGIEYWQSGDAAVTNHDMAAAQVAWATARREFDATYALDTRYDQAATYAAAGHIITGDISGAKTILTQHFGTAVVDQTTLIPAYYDVKDWDDLIAIVALHAKNHGDVASAFQLAAAYKESGNIAQAIQVVRDTIKAHPDAATQGAAYLAQLGAH
jgi:O-antigen ligase